MNYQERQAEFKRRAVAAVDKSFECIACFGATRAAITGDGRCGVCYAEDKLPAHVTDAQQAKWDASRPVTIKQPLLVDHDPELDLSVAARNTALRALQVIEHILEHILECAEKSARDLRPFDFPPEVIDALLRVVERCDIVADKVVAREPMK